MSDERKIKLRAWSLDEKRYITPDRFVDQPVPNAVEILSFDGYIELDTLGKIVYEQYIGEVDRHGKEICVGDILRIDIPFRKYPHAPLEYITIIAAVSFEHGAFWFTGGGFTNCLWFHYDAKDREIIGTVNEDPGLLVMRGGTNEIHC